MSPDRIGCATATGRPSRLAASMAATLLLLVCPACGGDDDGPPVIDGGADGGAAADGDVTDVDGAAGCTIDADCDDGSFCNGAEVCGGDGSCQPAPATACGDRTCDEGADACLTDCDEQADADGDGHDAVECGGDDCDDGVIEVNPEIPEVTADGIDQDCDGMELCYVDVDGDGFHFDATVLSADVTCSGPGQAGAEAAPGDCDDAAAAIHPGAAEVTGDGVDQDCDGLEACFADVDRDGYRPDDGTRVASDDVDCFDPGEADAIVPTGDCDDTDPLRNPGAAEIPGDEIDQNCDGRELCLVDADGDGVHAGTGVTRMSTDLTCDGSGEAVLLSLGGDCDDGNAAVHPFVVPREVCNGIDDDCDGAIDVFGGRAITLPCGTDVGRCTFGRQQCVGGAPSGACTGGIGPRSRDFCEGTDDDCDGAIDEGCGCAVGATRTCGLTAGACTPGTQTCNALGQWGACNGAAGPSAERCGDGLDNDCDGVADEQDALGCTTFYVDRDGDGYANTSVPGQCLCAAAGFYTVRPPPCPPTPPPPPPGACAGLRRDCDDSNPGIHPGARERCDATDWDCDGEPREVDAMGCRMYATDVDGDGVGSDTFTQCLCGPTTTFPATTATDCCDWDDRVFPGQTAWSDSDTFCNAVLPPSLHHSAFDFDCDGGATRRWTERGGCRSVCTSTDRGWYLFDTPSCGDRSTYLTDCYINPITGCWPGTHQRRQECR